jgi:hypothetical protein
MEIWHWPGVHSVQATFDVYFNGRNGSWTETLRVRLVNGAWKEAIRVFKGKKELYKRIDIDFPTE